MEIDMRGEIGTHSHSGLKSTRTQSRGSLEIDIELISDAPRLAALVQSRSRPPGETVFRALRRASGYD